PPPSTDRNGIILKMLCSVAEAMHQNVVALHTTNRMLNKDADLAQSFIHRLLRSASWWLRVLLTLTRLLIRNVKLIKLVIRLHTLIAQIHPNMQVAKPIHLWWELLFQHLVIMIMATNPDYSPTREIDRRSPFWRPDDPQHNRTPGSS